MGVALARVRAAAALRQNQAELRAVYDNSPIMMCVLDSRRCLLYMNRTMSEFIGKTEEELRYQRAVGIIGCVNALEDPRGCGYGTDCQACALRMALEDTLATGRSHSGIERSMTLVCRDGQREVTLLAATALIQTEAGKSLLVCLEDITRQLADEQRLADMQLQLHHTSRLAAMGELAAGIAHEVNQPLCSIVNFANACRNVASSESANWGQIRIWSDAIASSAAQAGDIIRRLISFARRPQADREVVQVQQLFDDAILLVQHEARANRVAVRLATADPGLTVHAQPVPIRQVMVNLLRNSIDALGAAASPSRPGAQSASRGTGRSGRRGCGDHCHGQRTRSVRVCLAEGFRALLHDQIAGIGTGIGHQQNHRRRSWGKDLGHGQSGRRPGGPFYPAGGKGLITR